MFQIFGLTIRTKTEEVALQAEINLLRRSLEIDDAVMLLGAQVIKSLRRQLNDMGLVGVQLHRPDIVEQAEQILREGR